METAIATHISKPKLLVDVFIMIVSIFLLIEGIWGTVSPVVFGVFSTNLLHAIIHIVLGGVGLFLSLRANSVGFSIILGVLLLIVGLLYFVQRLQTDLVELLNINTNVAVFNIVVGLLCLAVAIPSQLKPRVQRM